MAGVFFFFESATECSRYNRHRNCLLFKTFFGEEFKTFAELFGFCLRPESNIRESLSATFEALSQELLVRKGLNPVPFDRHPLPSRSGRRAESLGSPGKVRGISHKNCLLST